MSDQLIIAGFHRSGTSATARLLHRAGLFPCKVEGLFFDVSWSHEGTFFGKGVAGDWKRVFTEQVRKVFE